MTAARRRSKARSKSTWRRLFKRALLALGVVLIAPVPVILLLSLAQPPVTAVILQSAGSRLLRGERPVWPAHATVSRSGLSSNLRRAVLASEDDRFYLHHGIDFVEIQKALDKKQRGGTLRGASTLTQQVAKNLFLWNGRSFIRKGLEAYLTLLLELLLSKERILDLYLNLAEWGPNTFGAESGARLHFKKSAAALTRDEAARMAAILPAPRRWSPRGSIATRRATTILDRMRYAAPKPAGSTAP